MPATGSPGPATARRHRHPAELSAYVDGELGRLAALRLRAHLRRCEPCRRYVEQLRVVVALLAEARLIAPDASA